MDAFLDGSFADLALSIVVVIVFAFVAWRLQTITGPGAVVMSCMGLVILYVGGWHWLLPMVAFFGTSVMFSRIPVEGRLPHKPRDVWQVLANGGLATLGVVLAVVWHGQWRLVDSLAFYAGAVAAATADTWATELGTRFGGQPRDIITGRSLLHGQSGGITSVGTFAAACGALFIGLIAVTIPPDLPNDWIALGHVTLAGWLGAMLDSFLGAAMQIHYRCRICGEETESPVHCETSAAVRRGFLSNNQVNWACCAAGALATLAFVRW
jgi:uncharacterized protein (TIGR00297 family)